MLISVIRFNALLFGRRIFIEVIIFIFVVIVLVAVHHVYAYAVAAEVVEPHAVRTWFELAFEVVVLAYPRLAGAHQRN